MTDQEKKALSRERVLGISLLDFFIQIVFLLIILLGIGFYDIDREKYEKWIKDGTQIYGDTFSDNWINQVKLLESNKYTKIALENEALKKEIKKLQGFNPCLNISTELNKESLEFELKNGELIFLRFSPEFIQYAAGKSYIKKVNILQTSRMSFAGNINGIKQFNSTFSFMKESNCEHIVRVHNRNTHGWVNNNVRYKINEILVGMPYPMFEHYKIQKAR